MLCVWSQVIKVILMNGEHRCARQFTDKIFLLLFNKMSWYYFFCDASIARHCSGSAEQMIRNLCCDAIGSKLWRHNTNDVALEGTCYHKRYWSITITFLWLHLPPWKWASGLRTLLLLLECVALERTMRNVSSPSAIFAGNKANLSKTRVFVFYTEQNQSFTMITSRSLGEGRSKTHLASRKAIPLL